jgi:hypothetical protein
MHRVLIGPSGSGKTTLLSTLGAHPWRRARIVATAQRTGALFRAARVALTRGEILDATEDVEEHAFTIDGAPVSCFDAPGGSVFGEHATREEMVARSLAASSIVLCVDPASQDCVKRVVVDLESLLDRAASKRWDRVAVCLTKADVIHGDAAWRDAGLLQRLRHEDADPSAYGRLLTNAIRNLRSSADRSRAFWVSAYGFSASDGGPNVNARTGSLRVGVEEQELGPPKVDLTTLLGNWRPLNAIEPFLFAIGQERGE